MAGPNVVVMVVQTSIGLIEAFFVAELGIDASAAMALVFPVAMLVQMLSAGALGGGIRSAVSRILGAGPRVDAGLLAWHAAAIDLGLGIVPSFLALPLGPRLNAAMGGAGGSLRAAVIRGPGNIALPDGVTCAGGLVLISLSPVRIFGWSPLPRLGIVGGGVAFASYYAVGTAIFAAYLYYCRPKAGRREPPSETFEQGICNDAIASESGTSASARFTAKADGVDGSCSD